ncbi:MAG: MotA/TolQ/ExbB proton channel family protein [Candidatus Poribacteria bacterium]|nr:MotA/TolQ/ExbB proton channel family protein [Candidatus Poribacteria bacterium]
MKILVTLVAAALLVLIAWFQIPVSFQEGYEFTRGYVVFQIIVGGFAFGILWWIQGWYTHTNTVASILTVIGVFGTFLGIFSGLQAFDIQNIEASISKLLDSLKLAFLTSLVGIGLATFLKGIIAPLFKTSQKSRNPIEEERDKFVDALKSIETSGEINLLAQLVKLDTTVKEEGIATRETLSNIGTNLAGIHVSLTREEGATLKQLHHLTTTFSNKYDELIQLQTQQNLQIHERLNSITEALTGEDESTVFVQLQELTSTVSEKVGEIAAKVGEVATGQLIEALREVIRDFNKNLTEQFGENFKQLNEAVGKTVEWQEQYRQQMDELAKEFQMAAESVEQSRIALASAAQSLMTIEDQSVSLVSIAERLDPILHTLNDQLEAFSELRQRAHEAFPLIENRLNDLTTGFSNTVEIAITDSHDSMETQRAALATQVDQLQRTTNETHQQVIELTTNFSDTIKTSIDESQASMSQQRETLTNQLQQLQTTLITSNQQLHQTISDIRDRLDSVFERSANHIAQVTTGFTQNLTQDIQNILKNQTQELGNIVERNREDIDNHVNTLHSALRKEVNTFNESLEKELATSLQVLAGHFESLSNGFVNNYRELVGPYTQVIVELQQLVEASRRGLR